MFFRLRGARILLIGLGGLGAEVAKNIVLAGIKSLTLLDHQLVTKEAFTCQFLIPRSELGKNRAESSLQRVQLLNPMVEITADTDCVTDKDNDFFANFDVICATCCQAEQLKRINSICHEKSILFYAGDVCGFYGTMFADLNSHEYAEEVKGSKEQVTIGGEAPPAAKKQKTEEEAETKTVKKTKEFSRFTDALTYSWSGQEKRLKRTPKTFFIYRILLAFREKFSRDPSTEHLEEDKKELKKLRTEVAEGVGVDSSLIQEDFYDYCFAELGPVCAVVGGVLGQEIIKAVSQKDSPHCNFFFFDGVSGDGMVDCIP